MTSHTITIVAVREEISTHFSACSAALVMTALRIENKETVRIHIRIDSYTCLHKIFTDAYVRMRTCVYPLNDHCLFSESMPWRHGEFQSSLIIESYLERYESHFRIGYTSSCMHYSAFWCQWWYLYYIYGCQSDWQVR